MSTWPHTVMQSFALIGMLTVLSVIFIVLIGLYIFIKEKIEFWHKRYIDKHRMEKPPMCKCYCTQCGCWKTSKPERDIGLCTVWQVWTKQYESCTRGSLRTEEEYKDEKFRTESIASF